MVDFYRFIGGVVDGGLTPMPHGVAHPPAVVIESPWTFHLYERSPPLDQAFPGSNLVAYYHTETLGRGPDGARPCPAPWLNPVARPGPTTTLNLVWLSHERAKG